MRRWGPGAAWLVFPLLVLAVLGVLVALDVNGSSVGLLHARGTADPDLLAGTPRTIRADEAAISTPNIVGNIRRGLPVQPWVGLTPTFLPATSLGAPAAHWTETFKPQDLGFVAGTNRGFAFHWWWQVAAGVLGLFALLVALTGAGWLAAGLAVLGGFTPYVAWWSVTPGATLGYLAGATAAAVLALRARVWWVAALLGAGAGYLVTAAFLLLYPPWLVSVGWVVAGILIGVAIDRRVPWRRLLTAAGSAAVVLVSSLTVWYAESGPAIKATAGTIYPGSRLSAGGGGNVAWLLDAPVNPWVAAAPQLALRGLSQPAVGDPVAANQSETASVWLPLPILVVLVVAVLLALRNRPTAASYPGANPAFDPVADPDPDTAVASAAAGEVPPLRWTTVGVSAAGLLLLAWALLPLPGWFGRLTLLNRVPGNRTTLALGLVAIVLLGIGATVLGRRRPTWPWLVAWVVAAGATTWAGTWAGRALPWGDVPAPPLGRLALVSAFFAVGFVLLMWRRVAGVAVALLVVGSIASWSLVNPWYVGLGPLDHDPVTRAMAPLATEGHVARVAVYGDESLAALVQASGVEMLADVTVYPDAAVWNTLAPDQKDLWNNYAKYRWVPDPTAQPATIHQIGSTTANVLDIDPCATQTLALDIGWVVSSAPMRGFACLTPYDTIRRSASQTVYRYTVHAH